MGREASIPLSKEFGVNPTMPVCYWCGKDTGEIALLGRNYKEHGREAQAPSRMILNDEPCPECREKLDSGAWVAWDGECGHSGLIKREALEAIVVGQTIAKTCKRIRFEKCPKCMGMA